MKVVQVRRHHELGKLGEKERRGKGRRGEERGGEWRRGKKRGEEGRRGKERGREGRKGEERGGEDGRDLTSRDVSIFLQIIPILSGLYFSTYK